MTEPVRDPEEFPTQFVLELGELSIRSQRDGTVHTISLSGELDLATAEAVELELARVEATDAETVVLDLSGLHFMDSTGVRLVVAANARFRDSGQHLSLVRGPANVQRVLELCGVVELLPFADG
jgi:anti-anti-sigma factor